MSVRGAIKKGISRALFRFPISRKGVRWQLLPGEIVSSWNLFLYGELYPEVRKKLLEQGPQVIWDVGANLGGITIPIAIKDPNIRIYAFEPNSKCYDALGKTIARNKIHNVELLKYGLSDKDSARPLFYSNHHSGANSVHRAELAGKLDGKETIELKTGDGCGIEVPDIIKVDIQSHEPAFVFGSKNLLKTHRPSLILEFRRSGWDRCAPGSQSTLQTLKKLYSRVEIASHGEPFVKSDWESVDLLGDNEEIDLYLEE